MSKTRGCTRSARYVLHHALHALHTRNALTHTFDTNSTLVFSFFGTFLPCFRPDNDVKSPNCRFFRGRKPDVAFQYPPLPFFSKFLHSASTLLNHIWLYMIYIRYIETEFKRKYSVILLTYIWVNGIHQWRKYGQMITFACCFLSIRFTRHKLAASGFPQRRTSRSPKDTCCFQGGTGWNTNLKGRKRGENLASKVHCQWDLW